MAKKSAEERFYDDPGFYLAREAPPPIGSIEEIELPEGGPNGGVRAVAYYFNENRELITKGLATGMEIVEYDKNDNELSRTYGEIVSSR